MNPRRLAWAIPFAVAATVVGESAQPPAGDPARPAAAPPLKAVARLTEITPTPSAEEIRPYDQALVIHTYRIVRVVDGPLDEQDIAVAHWAIRRKRPVPTPDQAGRLYQLTLIPFQDCPLLRNERIVDRLGRADLILYYADQWAVWPLPASPDTHPPATPPNQKTPGRTP